MTKISADFHRRLDEAFKLDEAKADPGYRKRLDETTKSSPKITLGSFLKKKFDPAYWTIIKSGPAYRVEFTGEPDFYEFEMENGKITVSTVDGIDEEVLDTKTASSWAELAKIIKGLASVGIREAADVFPGYNRDAFAATLAQTTMEFMHPYFIKLGMKQTPELEKDLRSTLVNFFLKHRASFDRMKRPNWYDAGRKAKRS